MKSANELKKEIIQLTREYSRITHKSQRPGDDKFRSHWEKGSPIPYAGRVFTEDEVEAAVSSTLDFWLTLGSEGSNMELELASFLGVKKSLLVNSGSSANLIAIYALTSHKIKEDKRIKPGDEVITVAAGFPTTVAPIIQAGAVPVFIDADPVTGNAKCEELEDAYCPKKTKAVMFAHALGNPFDLLKTIQFCKKYDLFLIEDNCDALGCSYSMPKKIANELGFHSNSPGLDDGPNNIIRWTGTWGDISTQSFYPPHHLTMGEGGAVNIIHSTRMAVIAESFRDWGRDCWCPSGIDNTCQKRFEWKLGDLPKGYDHKYTYSHLGFNLKPLDIQASIGRVQLKRLPSFIEQRKKNWEYLREGLSVNEEFLEFALPTHSLSWNKNKGLTWDDSGCKTECSWFGFKISIKENANFSRTDLAKLLDENKIGNRMLFGGNLIRQPAFIELKKQNSNAYRIASNTSGSDKIMNQTLFLGTYPGLTKEMLDFEITTINKFVEKMKSNL